MELISFKKEKIEVKDGVLNLASKGIKDISEIKVLDTLTTIGRIK